MKKFILGLLLIYSVNVLEASSGIAIGYNPADFTIVGKSLPRTALTSIIVTTLHNSRCSYSVVATEDPSMMEVIEKEIEFSSSTYVDPANRLTPNFMVATHLVKGNAIFGQGSVSINLRIEDRQGSLTAQAKVSGPEDSFWKLIEEASRSLASQMCREPYYTVTTSKKITSHLKVLENYRGLNKDLKSYTEDKNTYYIYIDAEKAKINEYHVSPKSTRTIHRETYKLNHKSCKYEIEKEDKLVKNLGGQYIFKSEDAGWGFEDDTKISVHLPSSDKDLSFKWGKLRETGHYSNSKKYKKKIPQMVKNMMGKVNDMTALFRKESKNSKEIEIFKSLYDYPGTPEHVQCGGKVAMETFLIPPLDALQDPDIDFKINIRPSTKSEMKIMKKVMENGSNSPMDIIKLLQTMEGKEK